MDEKNNVEVADNNEEQWKRVNIYLPLELARLFEDRAKVMGLKTNQLIRVAMVEYIEKLGK